MLYEHLPPELPNGWVQANYVSGTHYLAWPLFNEANEFSDVFRRYLALKEPTTSLVRACSDPPKVIAASRKDERDALLQRRAVFMGSDEQPGGNWDARIRSWIGLSDRSGSGDELKFSKKLLPIKRESLEELLWRLGLQPYELPERGWCGRTPYHSSERRWRQGESKIPTKLPREAKEKLLKPLRQEVPELADLTEEELAGVLFLLRANPPYSMAREHDLEKLTPEQRDRVQREDNLQKTRVLTQLFAAREERALRLLREALENPEE
jgi:hypothetical protein